MTTKYIIEQAKNGWEVTKMSYNIDILELIDANITCNKAIDIKSSKLVFQTFNDMLLYLIEEIKPKPLDIEDETEDKEHSNWEINSKQWVGKADPNMKVTFKPKSKSEGQKEIVDWVAKTDPWRNNIKVNKPKRTKK